MIKQYFEIKKQYPDTILFFRMGDFYEMFFEDAKIAAPILEVVLTSRDKNKKNAVPLCGIPYHAKDNYAAKLLKNGFKVAICEQVEDPALAKGIVRREVTHILTPATALEIDQIDTEINKYVVSIYADDQYLAMAALDIGVADFEVRHFHRANINSFANEFFRKAPIEIVIPSFFRNELNIILKNMPGLPTMLINELPDYEFNFINCEQIILNQLGLKTLEGLGMTDFKPAVITAGVLIKYLQGVRKTNIKNISSIHFFPNENYLILDNISFQNLDILKNSRTGDTRGSLIEAIDLTITPMGRRLLKKWLSYPLIETEKIEARLDGIEEFSKNLVGRTEIRRILKNIGDLAKLNSKIALSIVYPLHLLKLKDIQSKIPLIIKSLDIFNADLIKIIHDQLDPLIEICSLIDSSIDENPSNNLNEGNYIKKGFNQELDELRSISRNAKQVISAMEKTEKENTGIQSLKIKFNKVFGYFIEITNPHLKNVPSYFMRKQTLVNAERFITSELKDLEDKILRAEERILKIEKELYQQIVKKIQVYGDKLNRNADLIGLMDVLSTGGELVQSRNYIRPKFIKGREINIKEGRHPVLEISSEHGFIPNDLNINANSDQILLITGPNMGGKSTYLRQNALIVVMAQAGYFVPAEKATMGICDRIFTRIGASDALLEGKSTFLVEMIETSIILNNATDRSLILLDEVGRGTSTFDGLSIAWATVEYLHQSNLKPMTLFATHYHELTELAEILDRVKNYHITVREWQDNVVFLHKIAPGASDQSFGIHVAKIAGLPMTVIERSKEILLNLEKKEMTRLLKERLTGKIQKIPEMPQSLFPEDKELKIWDEIRERLKEIDITNITPLQALNILHFLKLKSDSLINN